MKKIKFIFTLLLVFFFTFSYSEQKNKQNIINYDIENQFTYDDSCEKFLKNYEEFIVEYIAIYKKYKEDPTNMSIMNNYTKLASKAAEFQTASTENCSSEQLIRLSEIVQKLNKSLMSILDI